MASQLQSSVRPFWRPVHLRPLSEKHSRGRADRSDEERCGPVQDQYPAADGRDLQTLDTLGSLLQYKDAESLIRRFGQTKGHNDFEQISFYGSSGTEAAAALPDESVRTVIEEAWKGNSGVSRIYHEEGTGRNMFTCAVPVCPEGAVEGLYRVGEYGCISGYITG